MAVGAVGAASVFGRRRFGAGEVGGVATEEHGRACEESDDGERFSEVDQVFHGDSHGFVFMSVWVCRSWQRNAKDTKRPLASICGHYRKSLLPGQ